MCKSIECSSKNKIKRGIITTNIQIFISLYDNPSSLPNSFIAYTDTPKVRSIASKSFGTKCFGILSDK